MAVLALPRMAKNSAPGPRLPELSTATDDTSTSSPTTPPHRRRRRPRIRRSALHGGPLRLERPRALPRRRSGRRTAIVRPPANSCPVSCPFPAIATTSPGRASWTARRMARRRSGSSTYAPPPSRAPGSIIPMMAAGSSLRGLSLVNGEVRGRGRGPPHQGALAPVPVAAGAEDHDRPPPGPTSGRPARRTFSMLSGVCA